jgi:WD40 repeat protein
MPETPFEEQVRTTLREQADAQSFDPWTVKSTARRARRRLQRDALLVAGCAALALAAFIRVGAPFADAPVPAKPPVRLSDEVITYVDGSVIKTIHADGSDERTIASPCVEKSCAIGGMSWSPTGSELAFSTTSGRFEERFSPIDVVGSDGKGLRVLRDCPTGPPTWSPDGTQIAVPHSGTAPLPNGQREVLRPRLYTCGAEGGDAQQVSSLTAWGPAISWSPDGREFAYVDAHNRIVVVAADGTDRRVIARAAGGGPEPFNELAWSPDGSRIAYTAWHGNPVNNPAAARLWVINVDGSDPHVVLQGRTIQGPAWSPDGTRIAVNAGDQTTSLVLVAADGTGSTTLAGGGGLPVWDPSGTTLAIFLGHELVLVPADGSPAQTVVGSIRDPYYHLLAWQPSTP